MSEGMFSHVMAQINVKWRNAELPSRYAFARHFVLEFTFSRSMQQLFCFQNVLETKKERKNGFCIKKHSSSTFVQHFGGYYYYICNAEITVYFYY